MLSYGTAGFRGPLEYVKNIIEPISIFLITASVSNNGNGFGIQLSASHNQASDHGIKLCEPNGVSIHKELEDNVQEVVTLFYKDSSRSTLYQWAIRNLPNNYYHIKPRIVIGADRRPGSDELIQLTVDKFINWCRILQLHDPEVYDCGIITTPMLHWITNDHYYREYNDEDTLSKEEDIEFKELYLLDNRRIWDEFLDSIKFMDIKHQSSGRIFDFAYGVGSITYDSLHENLEKINITTIETNEATDYLLLNNQCGADDLHKSLLSPRDIPLGLWNTVKYKTWFNNAIIQSNLLGITFDGDADRILYWRPTIKHTFEPAWQERYPIQIFDGDRIMSLWAMTLHFLLNKIPEVSLQDFNIKLVHTAYSNGGAIEFWERNRFYHEYAATGVKNLHPKAEEADVGIYFETNGHGTIVFSNKIIDFLSITDNLYARILLKWLSLSNELVGDAVRNVYLTEASLLILGISPNEWYNLYNDYYYKNTKIYGLDKSLLHVMNEDRFISSPVGIQEAIVNLTGSIGGRVVVRASGTEDLIRLYVEHENSEYLETLHQKAQEIINNFIPKYNI